MGNTIWSLRKAAVGGHPCSTPQSSRSSPSPLSPSHNVPAVSPQLRAPWQTLNLTFLPHGANRHSPRSQTGPVVAVMV